MKSTNHLLCYEYDPATLLHFMFYIRALLRSANVCTARYQKSKWIKQQNRERNMLYRSKLRKLEGYAYSWRRQKRQSIRVSPARGPDGPSFQ